MLADTFKTPTRPSELIRLEPPRSDPVDFWPTGPPPDDGAPAPVDLVDQRSAFAPEDVDQRPPFDLSA